MTDPSLYETQLVADYLGPGPGVFVDVGANDPVYGSMSWLLEQNGWTGLLVEPQAELAANLRANRSAFVADVACGAPEQHDTIMTLKMAGEASTLSATVLDLHYTIESERQVPVVTLDSLLEKFAIPKIDFLVIDVEGFEIEVLRGLSIDKYAPRLLVLEDRVRNHALHRYVLGCDYKLVRRVGLNAWYVPIETEFPVPLGERMRIFRKYYLGLPLRLLKLRFDRIRWKLKNREA